MQLILRRTTLIHVWNVYDLTPKQVSTEDGAYAAGPLSGDAQSQLRSVKKEEKSRRTNKQAGPLSGDAQSQLRSVKKEEKSRRTSKQGL
ncbi:unnamed protein product [Gongylonema pulchrum]|uniref:Uncharacterized protein n=1 Tax=Gongylonema pulchrum TaxID=637853 RepID=A0A183F0P3_9BILA|nr:unnamed protein product [Gongylonema pulchrum]